MLSAERENTFLVELGQRNDCTGDSSRYYGEIFKAVGVPEGKILDVGSHDARLARWFLENGIIRNVVSLDILNLSVKEEFVRANATRLPFRDNSFDSIVSLASVPSHCGLWVPKAAVVSELTRVAKSSVIIWPAPRFFRLPDNVAKRHVDAKGITSASPNQRSVLVLDKR